jgi:acetyltransferase-like isoleucine patch superfamily enzyme
VRVGQAVLSAIRLRRCASVGRRVRTAGRIWVHGEGRVIISDDVTLDGSAAPIELFPWAGAELVIGPGTVIGGGTSIECTRSIRIGARVIDSHFHALIGTRHVRPAPRPVVIGDHAVLGPRCIVMAGADIATGMTYGAASIIRQERRRSARFLRA